MGCGIAADRGVKYMNLYSPCREYRPEIRHGLRPVIRKKEGEGNSFKALLNDSHQVIGSLAAMTLQVDTVG